MRVILPHTKARVELITNILIEYLKYNKRIVVPKLGAFIVKQQSGVIIFSDLMRNDDGVLRSLLIAYGMKELEATGMLDRFVFDIHHAISRDQVFTIEGLGDFSKGENNTIIFKHKREPLVIGGNIKPPVEGLNIEKLKLQRIIEGHSQRQRATTERGDRRNEKRNEKRNDRREAQRDANRSERRNDKHEALRADKHDAKSKRQAANREEEIDTLTLGKPDAYLRGLKYDKNKNKKRNEERADVKRHKGPSLILIVIIALIVGGGVWAGWQWLSSDRGDTASRESSKRDEAITAIEQDTTAVDTLTGADISVANDAESDTSIEDDTTDVNENSVTQ